jgi:hypothetical protein
VNGRSLVLFVLLLLAALVFACETDVAEQGEDDGGTVYAIDLGQVTVGTFEDTCITIGPTETEGSISGTIVIECSGFHFVDTASEQTFDTFSYDLTYPGDTILCVRFEPEEAVPALCTVELGSGLGDLEIGGTGVLADYDYRIFHPGTSVDLYDVTIYENLEYWLTVIVKGDSGIAMYADEIPAYESWDYVCGGALEPPYAIRDIEHIYLDGEYYKGVSVGGGGVSDGIVFRSSMCDPPQELEKVEYFTSSFAFKSTDWISKWVVGKGKDVPGGYNGIFMETPYTVDDSLVLHQPTSEISCIDGSNPSDIWAVLSQPSSNLYHYNGESWELRAESWMTESLYGIWVDEGSGEAFTVGTNGAIYHYTGSMWEDQSLDFEAGTLYAAWGNSPVDVYAIGEGTALYHYNGGSWGVVPTPHGIDATLYGIHGYDAEPYAFFVVGENGTVIGYAVGAYW